MQLQGTLIKYNESELPSNFVSIAVFLNGNTPEHAAILIRHNSSDYLYHYPGFRSPPVVEEGYNYENVLFYKILDFFDTEDESDVGAFLQYCKRVCQQTSVTYGYIMDGSSYDNQGRYQALSNLPEIATCVGFCVNTLTNAITDIEDSYFNLEDWDSSGVDQGIDQWSIDEATRKYPSLDWNQYNAFKKRITPLEYLCSAFCSVYPITKQTINSIHDIVKTEIDRQLA
ncbi:hypothetical protein [Chryseobacterium viscerum]|uniref:Uncharacterized protein n=1 Tax=Chryseobacterium viscerum TaxID=1037377 RepID=A0A5N4BT20_9FLAO|nr:hypothetical protein [Chryseobacterium viscerum]KAB1231589.1 hypothetical protein F8D52_07225 [Chryseobacterium viscerum]